MNPAEIAAAIAARLSAAGVRLTLGGEPTLVPDDPQGAEWLIAAVGPTKLRYAYRLANALIGQGIAPGAAAVLSPGKRYPGETNPRWVLNLLWNPAGPALAPRPPAVPDDGEKSKAQAPNSKALTAFRRALAGRLGLAAEDWLPARDEVSPTGRRNAAATAHVLPLDHDGDGWFTDAPRAWRELLKTGGRTRYLPLVNAAGGAGLRLPLGMLPENALRRALTVETDLEDGALRVFLPPLLQAPWMELLAAIYDELEAVNIHAVRLDGYVPANDADSWRRLGLTADPGVLEINLPPCEGWPDYARWLSDLETAGPPSACARGSPSPTAPNSAPAAATTFVTREIGCNEGAVKGLDGHAEPAGDPGLLPESRLAQIGGDRRLVLSLSNEPPRRRGLGGAAEPPQQGVHLVVLILDPADQFDRLIADAFLDTTGGRVGRDKQRLGPGAAGLDRRARAQQLRRVSGKHLVADEMLQRRAREADVDIQLHHSRREAAAGRIGRAGDRLQRHGVIAAIEDGSGRPRPRDPHQRVGDAREIGCIEEAGLLPA